MSPNTEKTEKVLNFDSFKNNSNNLETSFT